tara:strand:+ start:2457 stop:3029 length:573 start_codon:yes stop_codon:yes gene_type:complete
MIVKYKGSNDTWGLIAISFHWVLAILLFIQFASGIRLSTLNFSSAKLELIDIHQSIGSVIMIIVFFRLLWRLNNTKPSNTSIPKYHVTISQFTHMTVYLLLFSIPILGILYNWLSDLEIILFGFLKIPNIISLENDDIADILIEIHYYLALLLMLIIFIHICAAFYHLIIIRDKYKIFYRMGFKSIKEKL